MDLSDLVRPSLILTPSCRSLPPSLVDQEHLFAPDSDSMYGPDHVTYVDPEVRTTLPMIV